jgi:general L-amino acid transport system substrate-binding protein
MERLTRRLPVITALVVFALLAVACSDDSDDASGTTTTNAAGGTGGGAGDSVLDEVKERGTLNCGVNDAVPGFGFVEEDGSYSGFDIEFCRVIAAAVLGDATKVEFKPLTADQRFTALQSGDIDVLVRNTTYTASRDGGEGAAFVTTTFYDGQGMMVRADSGFDSIDDMRGTTVCVLQGTTTELNLATRTAGLDVTPLPFAEVDQIQSAFIAEQCDGWTSDKSQLAGIRSAFPTANGGPASLVILDESFSKEPLGPVVVDGDSDWYDAVNWAVMATIQAEEFGITKANVEQMKKSDDANIARFLGQPFVAEEGEDPAVLDPELGLDPDFAVNVISQVGNYAEIYDRNVGTDSPLGLERGLNALWNAEEPGLHYAIPYR